MTAVAGFALDSGVRRRAERSGGSLYTRARDARNNPGNTTTMGLDLPSLPERPHDAHKGTFGRVAVVAGSRGMSGAATLAGLGALRGGAGLVYVCVPEGILPIVAGFEPSFLTVPLAEDSEGRLTAAACGAIEEKLADMDAAAVGPGWGQSQEIRELTERLYKESSLPMVVDADALNALATAPAALADHAGPRVVTPHPGEFAKLTGREIAEIQSNREQSAAEFAAANRVVVLLKGAGTVVTDGRDTFVNSSGNSGMGTGGTGDVLTGLIAALLAQGMSAVDAARLGAYLHGLAGDLAAAVHSEPGLIASDLPRYLGMAWIRTATER